MNQVIENDPSVGSYSGECYCPNGQIYLVGDNRDNCESLACKNGISGDCQKSDVKTPNNRVICVVRIFFIKKRLKRKLMKNYKIVIEMTK